MKNVFAVEDDKFLRELLASKLIAEGYAVETAVDGKEALEKLPTVKADVILLDLILPDVNGFEILEKIKASPEHKETPVIVLSNLDQKEDLEKAKKLGAADFMIKANFALSEIVSKIRGILQ